MSRGAVSQSLSLSKAEMPREGERELSSGAMPSREGAVLAAPSGDALEDALGGAELLKELDISPTARLDLGCLVEQLRRMCARERFEEDLPYKEGHRSR